MTQRDIALAMLRMKRVVSALELRRMGVSDTTVRRLCDRGEIDEVARGHYRLSAWPTCGSSDEVRIADLASVYPDAVFCLASAARLHGLTDRGSDALTLAIPHEARRSSSEVRFVRWRNPEMFSVGVETALIDGVEVRVTSPARTVADFFRPQHRIPEPEGYEVFNWYLAAGGDATEVGRIAWELGWGETTETLVKAATHLPAR